MCPNPAVSPNIGFLSSKKSIIPLGDKSYPLINSCSQSTIAVACRGWSYPIA